jgi:putative peptide zinc metalloprotease protein
VRSRLAPILAVLAVALAASPAMGATAAPPPAAPDAGPADAAVVLGVIIAILGVLALAWLRPGRRRPTATAAPSGPERLAAEGGPRLAPGVEVFGEYQGSGYLDPRYLARRGDDQMVALSPLLHALLSALDGRRDEAALARLVSERLGRRVDQDGVRFLLDERLRPAGLVLAPGQTWTPVPRARPMLSLVARAALVPRRTVRALARAVAPLFRAPVVLAVLLALGAVDVWILGILGVAGSLEHAVRAPATLLIVAGLLILSGGFHELGHATACRYGGGRPGTIGVGIYLVWPVFYSDITDTYRLSRRGRLRADLGGLYFNAVALLVAAGAFAATGARAILVFIVVQQVQMLFQFMPWLRLDGYYVVSDLAGVPDLFSRLRPAAMSLVRPRTPQPRMMELTPRARRIVRGWVLTTAPVVLAVLAALVLGAPHILRTAWTSGLLRAQAAREALGAGAVASGMWSLVELTLLLLPAIGLTVTAGIVLVGSRRAVRRALAPVRLAAGRAFAGRAALVRGGAVAGALMVAAGAAFMLVPSEAPTPEHRGAERIAAPAASAPAASRGARAAAPAKRRPTARPVAAHRAPLARSGAALARRAATPPTATAGTRRRTTTTPTAPTRSAPRTATPAPRRAAPRSGGPASGGGAPTTPGAGPSAPAAPTPAPAPSGAPAASGGARPAVTTGGAAAPAPAASTRPAPATRPAPTTTAAASSPPPPAPTTAASTPAPSRPAPTTPAPSQPAPTTTQAPTSPPPTTTSSSPPGAAPPVVVSVPAVSTPIATVSVPAISTPIIAINPPPPGG